MIWKIRLSMNKGLQRSLSDLENAISIQRDCVNPEDPNSRDYMHGMLNGLICAHSFFTGDQPKYYTMPSYKNRKVRHKSFKKLR